jgi:hypothetical protein
MPRVHQARAPSPPARTFSRPFFARRNSYREPDREPADPPPNGTSRHSRGGGGDDSDYYKNTAQEQNNVDNQYTTNKQLTQEEQQPEVLEPVGTMQSMPYSLEAKPTRATFAETFSSGEEEPTDYIVRQHRTNTFSSRNEEMHPHHHHDDHDDIGHHQPSRSKSSSYEDSYLNGSNEESTAYDSGEEFINLAQEAARIPSRHYRQPTTAITDGQFMHHEEYQKNTNYDEQHHEEVQQYYDHEEHYYQQQSPQFHPGLEEEKVEEQSYYEDYTDTQHDTIHFVDSETDQVFTFGTQGGSTRHQRTAVTVVETSSYDDQQHQQYQQPPGYASYDYTSHHARTADIRQNQSFDGTSMGYDECSKTLNTNLETLHTDLEGVNYIPTRNNDHDVVHDQAYLPQRNYEGESYDDDEQRIGEGQYYGSNHPGNHIPQNASYMYEDDGYIHYQDGEEEYYEDDTRFEQVSFQDTVTEYTKDVTSHAAETRDGDYTEVISQLMDSYLSDRSSNSSWDEGSYASPTRNRSRVDSYDDTEYSDDGSTSSRRKGGRTLMDVINKFTHMNTRDNSYDEDDDEERDDDENEDDGGDDDERGKKKKNKKSRRRSRRKSKKGDLETILGNIGSTAMELLNETIDQTTKGSAKSSRRRSRGGRRRRDDQAGKIMDSFSSIFSCGAPRHY